MPLPFLAIAIGAAVAGAVGVAAVASRSSSSSSRDAYEDWDSQCQNQIKASRTKLKRALRDYSQAKCSFNQACLKWGNSSGGSHVPAMGLLGINSEHGLQEATKRADAKFRVILRKQLDRCDEVEAITKKVGSNVRRITTLLEQTTQTFEQLLTRYREAPAHNQELMAALNLLLNFNALLMLPLPLFDPTEDSSNPLFALNPSFKAMLRELRATLKFIEQIQTVEPSPLAVVELQPKKASIGTNSRTLACSSCRSAQASKRRDDAGTKTLDLALHSAQRYLNAAHAR